MSDYNRKQPLIAVVGSLNMDLVVKTDTIPEEGETVSGEELHYLAGGKGANQAVAAARLGAQTTMIGAVGSDGFGEHLLHSLTESGADASQVRILEDMVTGTAVVTTLGPEGAVYAAAPGGRVQAGRAGACRAPGYAVSAVDTTGAGDCFNGALAVALARGETLDAAVGFAMGAAALSVTKLGAQSGMPSAREIEAFLAEHAPEAQ